MITKQTPAPTRRRSAGGLTGYEQTANWRIEHGYHFGGFARKNSDLEAFIAEFKHLHGLDLEWVYVAKMMYGLYALIERGDIGQGSKVLAVITGPPGSA